MLSTDLLLEGGRENRSRDLEKNRRDFFGRWEENLCENRGKSLKLCYPLFSIGLIWGMEEFWKDFIMVKNGKCFLS